MLTKRQREVLLYVASGGVPKNCADTLGISYGTFRTHLALAFAKLGARSDAHAVAIAMRKGLIQ